CIRSRVTAPPWASSHWRAAMSVIGWRRPTSGRLPSMRSAFPWSARSSNPGSIASASLPNPPEPRRRTPTSAAARTINKERKAVDADKPMIEQMQTLGLAEMAAAYRQLAEQDNTAALSRDEWLGLMLDREVAVRADRRLTNRLAAAKLRFPDACIEDI